MPEGKLTVLKSKIEFMEGVVFSGTFNYNPMKGGDFYIAEYAPIDPMVVQAHQQLVNQQIGGNGLFFHHAPVVQPRAIRYIHTETIQTVYAMSEKRIYFTTNDGAEYHLQIE